MWAADNVASSTTGMATSNPFTSQTAPSGSYAPADGFAWEQKLAGPQVVAGTPVTGPKATSGSNPLAGAPTGQPMVCGTHSGCIAKTWTGNTPPVETATRPAFRTEWSTASNDRPAYNAGWLNR